MKTPPPSAYRAKLDELAAQAPSLRDYRQGVLAALQSLVRFDAALFHAMSPRVPLSTGVLIGIDPALVQTSMRRWDDVAVELGALRELANRHLVTTDREVYPVGSRARARFERVVTRPFGMHALCLTHLVVRDAVRSAIFLFSRKHEPFRPEGVAILRTLAPGIAVADNLHTLLDGAADARVPRRLVCRDERLTARQREIVEHVALGHTNAAIASALGLSANTTRNHLARVFARVGAANRADLVRLAVLRPSTD